MYILVYVNTHYYTLLFLSAEAWGRDILKYYTNRAFLKNTVQGKIAKFAPGLFEISRQGRTDEAPEGWEERWLCG